MEMSGYMVKHAGQPPSLKGTPGATSQSTLKPSGSQPVGTRKPPSGYPEATLKPPHSLPKASPKSESSSAGALGAWHSIEKSGEPGDAAWRSDEFDGTTQRGQGKTLDFPAVWRLPRQKRTLARKTVVKPPLLLGP